MQDSLFPFLFKKMTNLASYENEMIMQNRRFNTKLVIDVPGV
jgi:hypothetical protein